MEASRKTTSALNTALYHQPSCGITHHRVCRRIYTRMYQRALVFGTLGPTSRVYRSPGTLGSSCRTISCPAFQSFHFKLHKRTAVRRASTYRTIASRPKARAACTVCMGTYPGVGRREGLMPGGFVQLLYSFFKINKLAFVRVEHMMMSFPNIVFSSNKLAMVS